MKQSTEHPNPRVAHRSSRPPPATRVGRSLTASRRFEQHVSTQDDLGAVRHRDLLSTTIHAAKHDSVEQAVQKPAFLLDGECRPGVEQAAVGQVGGQLLVLAQLGEAGSRLVECVLAGF
jgi:hypothetical protein